MKIPDQVQCMIDAAGRVLRHGLCVLNTHQVVLGRCQPLSIEPNYLLARHSFAVCPIFVHLL